MTTGRVFFADKIIETIVTAKASVADAWVKDIRSKYINGERIIVGLDCERKPHWFEFKSDVTATLQLCVDDKCLIVQLFYMDYIPQSIKDFLNDPKVTFVGVEVEDDVARLWKDHELNCSNTADVRAMAMSHWPSRWPDRSRRPGLKTLAYEVVSLQMIKPKRVTLSNWGRRELTPQQIEYGCIDAYASYRIGHKLFEISED